MEDSQNTKKDCKNKIRNNKFKEIKQISFKKISMKDTFIQMKMS